MNDGGGLPDLSGLLSRVTENPQAMSMLGSLLGGMSAKPPPSPPPEEPPKEDSAAEEPREKPVFSTLPPHRGGKQEERRRLLLAIRPFLSPERRRALETLLPILEALALLLPRKEPPCT